MLILQDLSAEVPDTNAFHFNLTEHSNQQDKDSVLMYGYNASDNKHFHAQCENYRRKIYFNNWSPCEFAQKRDDLGHDAFKKELYFTEVYTICPYTNKWLNDLKLGRTYKDIFYPYNEGLIPAAENKAYDVIYHGGIHGQEHVDCLGAMTDFNYRYCTMTTHINQLTQRCLPYATNVNLSFRDKIKLVAQSKISICYNLVHVAPEHIPAIQSYTDWNKNIAFAELEKWNVMPQFKTRVHEAAISRTLNLVQKDPWNIIEDYYEPDEDFIYFNDPQDLKSKIREISTDWENYSSVVDSAYTKSLNYTTHKFVDTIRREDSESG